MPRKHVTRKIVNDPTVDAALRDIYDELDALQPEMSDKYSKRPPQIGDVRIVETSDGGTATATLTQGGWMVDINSNFQPVSGTSGYKSLKGTRGTSRTPVKNESIKYDKNKNVAIGNISKGKIVLKNSGNELKVRDATDSNDVIVHAKKVKVSAVASAVNEIGKGSDSTHGNKFLTVHDGSTLRHTVMMNDSGVIDVGPGGLKLKMADNNLAFYNSSTTGKGMDFDLSLVTDGQTRTLKCPDASGTIALTSDIVTNHITNNAADVMTVSDFGANAALKIDADQPATAGAENSVGLHIDYDRIVAGSGTAAHNDIGIDLDINSASLGTSSVKGMDIDVVGATTGTHTATGIELNVSGADDHVGLSITTPDGASGREDIKIHSSANASDYCTIATMNAGATIITTVDADSDSADFTLNADGDITLNSETGIFIAQKGGTQFSAANSAYAGMILGYTRIANDNTSNPNNMITMDATLTTLQSVGGTYLSVAFTAPPSGNVEIQMLASVYASSKTVEFALVSDTSATEISETHTYDAGAQSSDETDVNMTCVSFAVTGLTAGSSYTYYIAGAETSSGTSYIRHGRFRTTGTHYPPIIIKAIALPATITTGE